MKKYVLMQAQIENDEIASNIKIIDNSNKIGEKQVEGYVAKGYKFVGYIESDLNPGYLKLCFEYEKNKKIDTLDSKIRRIYNIIDE